MISAKKTPSLQALLNITGKIPVIDTKYLNTEPIL